MDVNDLLQLDPDQQGFEQIQILQDPGSGLMAIHDTRLGPAFGGIRRWVYESPAQALADAQRLASNMTLKCAIAGIPGGGGKSVIMQHPGLDREAAYRCLAQHVQLMGGRYFTGPDVGTSAEDLQVMARHTAFVASPQTVGNLAQPTAVGVFAGVQAVAQRLGFGDLQGMKVVVQGLGEVGARLAQMLATAGAQLYLADLHPDRAAQLASKLGGQEVAADEVLAIPCDIFAPCALGGVIQQGKVQQLQARAIAGSANNVLASPAAGEELFQRGILYAPDFVINAGALVYGALCHLQGEAPPPERIQELGRRLGQILDASQEEQMPPEQIALRMAQERLQAHAHHPYFPETGS